MKKNSSYKSEFSKLMKEAMDEQIKSADAPQMDYSFMEDEYVQVRIKKERGWHKSLKRVAILLICFFTAVMAVSISISSEPAIAIKSEIERRLSFVIDRIVTNDENYIVKHSDEEHLKVTIDQYEDVNKVRNIIPDFPIPGYIPDAYTFNVLDLNKKYDNTYTATYEFVNSDGMFLYIIISENYHNENADIVINGVLKMEEIDGKTICLWEDQLEGTKGVSILKDSLIIDIISEMSEQEMLAIAKSF